MLTFTSGVVDKCYSHDRFSIIGDGSVIKEALPSWISKITSTGHYKVIPEIKIFTRVSVYVSVQFASWPHSNADFEFSILRFPCIPEGKATQLRSEACRVSVVPISFGQECSTFNMGDGLQVDRQTWEMLRSIDIDVVVGKNDRICVVTSHQGAPLHRWTASVSII